MSVHPRLGNRIRATRAGRPLERLEEAVRALNEIVIDSGGDPLATSDSHGAQGVAHLVGVGRPVTVVELASAAGDGAADLDETPARVLWFRSDWLSDRGLDAAQCSVIRVRGESMEPTLPDGSSILVDRADRFRRKGAIYVLRGDDGLVVETGGEGG